MCGNVEKLNAKILHANEDKFCTIMTSSNRNSLMAYSKQKACNILLHRIVQSNNFPQALKDKNLLLDDHPVKQINLYNVCKELSGSIT